MASTTSIGVARVAATAAQAVPGVLGLHAGTVGEVATYGEGGRVPGVRVRRTSPASVTLHLVVQFGRRVDDLADEVRERVVDALTSAHPTAGPPVVNVHIADVRTGPVELPPGDAELPAGGGAGR